MEVAETEGNQPEESKVRDKQPEVMVDKERQRPCSGQNFLLRRSTGPGIEHQSTRTGSCFVGAT